jgi:hypothetical protein
LIHPDFVSDRLCRPCCQAKDARIIELRAALSTEAENHGKEMDQLLTRMRVQSEDRDQIVSSLSDELDKVGVHVGSQIK